MWNESSELEFDHEPEYEPKCCLCKYFIRGEADSRWHPGERDSCNHPIASRSSYLPTFPFPNGCKYYEGRLG